MAQVLVVLAPGAEEIEAITVADVLVRAGQHVTIASTADTLVVNGSRDLPLAAHTTLDAVLREGRTFDLVYLPGGNGSAAVCREDERVQKLAAEQLAAGRRLGIICASVTALLPRGLGKGRTVTSYPGVRAQVEPHVAAWVDQPVVIDGNLVTSQGPGTALALGLTLARQLAGVEAATIVANAMLTRMPS
jgi:DJ-1 family protein